MESERENRIGERDGRDEEEREWIGRSEEKAGE